MELVYLWVKKYKNIQEQGFNFSPRFDCSYDERNNKLTICDKKKNECIDNDYIENFFGKDINVTAIVGKNGSGKSSVLKLIRQIIDRQVTDGSFLIFYDAKKSKYICIYTIIKIDSNVELEQCMILGSETMLPFFDYSLTYDDTINFKNEQIPVYPRKYKGLLSFHQELINNQKNILKNYKALKVGGQLEKFKEFFQPNEIKISFNLKNLKPYEGEIQLSEEKSQKYQELIEEFKSNILVTRALELIEEILNLISDKKAYEESINIKEEKNVFDINDAYNSLPSSLERELRKLEDENSKDYDGYSADNIWEEEERKKQLLSNNQVESIVKDEDNYCLFSFDIENDFPNELIDVVLDSFPLTYFQIDLIDNEKKLSDLSFGEQQLLFILNQIYTLAIRPYRDLYDYIDVEELAENGIDSSSPDRYYKINYIILLDEIDIGFHPNWQKRTIQYIIDFLNVTDDEKYYHLIFTTHSPFLISDIPKQNIIFLDTYKDDNEEGNCKVVEGLSQTFGANIHTLLSDSFFMKDGLMGEFAKTKIEEVVKLLKSKRTLSKKNQEFCKNIISIIGEPILQRTLEHQLNQKLNLNETELEKLEREQKEIQEKIDNLKSNNYETD